MLPVSCCVCVWLVLYGGTLLSWLVGAGGHLAAPLPDLITLYVKVTVKSCVTMLVIGARGAVKKVCVLVPLGMCI